MKRIGVAAIIRKNDYYILLGRRAKDPNRGLYVFPGGGLEEGETLEQAFCREVKEETGYDVLPNPKRWNKPVHVVELDDRIIIFAEGSVINQNEAPVSGSDLEEVDWFHYLPKEISPVAYSVYQSYTEYKDNQVKASYYNPYDGGPSSW